MWSMLEWRNDKSVSKVMIGSYKGFPYLFIIHVKSFRRLGNKSSDRTVLAQLNSGPQCRSSSCSSPAIICMLLFGAESCCNPSLHFFLSFFRQCLIHHHHSPILSSTLRILFHLCTGVIALFCRQYDIIKDNEPNNNKDKAKNSSECSTPEHPTGGLLRSKV